MASIKWGEWVPWPFSAIVNKLDEIQKEIRTMSDQTTALTDAVAGLTAAIAAETDAIAAETAAIQTEVDTVNTAVTDIQKLVAGLGSSTNDPAVAAATAAITDLTS